MDAVATQKFFEEEKPEYVFLAAAHVGGIMANNTYRQILFIITSDTAKCNL
jgi:GDP-L-fucose synthase